MFDLSKHPFFKEYIDPRSGITSYILKERVATVQLPFYYTNSSISADGELLWFYAAFPPNPNRFLGCASLNPENAWIRYYPQSSFNGASPLITPDNSGVWFSSGNGVYFMDTQGSVKTVGIIPESYIKNRYIYWLSTHLSLSADNKYLLLDGHIGDIFFVSLVDVKTGEFTLLHEFSYVHDHALFSPANPKLFLFPRDWSRNPSSGDYMFMEKRVWVMDTDLTMYKDLRPEAWEGHGHNTAHEWWTKSGLVCYVDYEEGIYECDPLNLETKHVWRRPVCHAHCNYSSEFFCADQTPYNWHNEPVQILLYDRKNQRETPIVSAMPQPPMPREPYHLDPHPHFSSNDEFIVYMTTVNNMIDVAITPSNGDWRTLF
jgi:hypothetical protein